MLLTLEQLSLILEALTDGHEFADPEREICRLCGEPFNTHRSWCKVTKAIDIIKSKIKYI